MKCTSFIIVFCVLLIIIKSCNSFDNRKTTPLTYLDSLTLQIQQTPNDHNFLYKRAIYYLSNNQPYDALSDINKAIQLDPDNANYVITLADIYFSMGNVDNCRKALLRAEDMDPTKIEPTLKLAELYLYLKDYNMMHAYVNKALEKDKKASRAYHIRGIALIEQGDSNKALQQLHLATEADPEYYRAFIDAGILASQLKNPLALNYLKTAIQLNPSSIEARYALAMYYQNNLMLNEAMQEYYNILSLDKNFAFAHFNLGYIHLVHLNLLDQAIKHFNDAINAKPDYVEAYYNRGYCYELKGNIFAAKNDYKQSLAIKNNYEKALQGLARIERY